MIVLSYGLKYCMNQELQNRLSRLIQENVNSFSMPLDLAIDAAFNELFGMPENPAGEWSHVDDDGGEFGESFLPK